MRLVGDRLVAVFELNALYDGDETLAALAVDTDDDPTTGDAQWDGVDLAVQAGDRMRAVDAVEGLRALLAHARSLEPAKPPLLYDD